MRDAGMTIAARRLGPGLVAAAAACVVTGVFVLVPPVHQDPAFHQFADRRTLLGIPNALDVLSNLPFVVVGLLGLAAARNPHTAVADRWERWPWLVLFLAVTITAFGSGLYHLAPSNDTLFLDRLPQTFITTALFSAVLAERTTVAAARRAFWPLLVAGAASVAVWRCMGDLRLYGVVQFFPTLALPVLLVVNPPRYTRQGGFWVAIGWYLAARLFEFLDYEIYAAVGVASGHTLKHVTAALAVRSLAVMVRTRESMVIPPSGSPPPSG
jgi:hypothetical protein